MTTAQFQDLDATLRDIVAGLSAAGRTRSARAIGQALRRSQQRRISTQKNPDGGSYAKRRRRIIRTQQGMKFIWNNEVRSLKNWRHGRGKYGSTITGFDTDKNEIRTFYRSDIERYLEIRTQHVSRTRSKSVPMFARLRTARFMKIRAAADGVSVGFSGVAARIARVHQFGLRDQTGAGAFAEYPARELLGISRSDERLIEEVLISSLGQVSK